LGWGPRHTPVTPLAPNNVPRTSWRTCAHTTTSVQCATHAHNTTTYTTCKLNILFGAGPCSAREYSFIHSFIHANSTPPAQQKQQANRHSTDMTNVLWRPQVGGKVPYCVNASHTHALTFVACTVGCVPFCGAPPPTQNSVMDRSRCTCIAVCTCVVVKPKLSLIASPSHPPTHPLGPFPLLPSLPCLAPSTLSARLGALRKLESIDPTITREVGDMLPPRADLVHKVHAAILAAEPLREICLFCILQELW
jgi:hypothetical protein